jgi:peptide/nickel transport system permease protein
MARFLLGRIAGGLFTLAVASVVIFFLIRLVPGDPTAAVFGDRNYNPEVAARLREFYGLEEPVHQQYLSWIGALLGGDFGVSLLTQTPVTEHLGERIPRTLYLMAGGVIVGLLIAVPAGLAAARFRGRWPDAAITSAATLLMAVPQFFVGLLLIIVVAVQLGLLPPSGYVDPSEDLVASIKSMILPWLTIGFAITAVVARVLRSSMLDVLGRDYIRTARARGASEGRVMRRHALRNAAIPTVTVVGLEIGYLLGGAIVVEKVFSIPGMGQLIVNSISQRDYPLVQAAILFYAAGFVVVNLVTDVAYGILDPRVRAAR